MPSSAAAYTSSSDFCRAGDKVVKQSHIWVSFQQKYYWILSWKKVSNTMFFWRSILANSRRHFMTLICRFVFQKSLKVSSCGTWFSWNSRTIWVMFANILLCFNSVVLISLSKLLIAERTTIWPEMSQFNILSGTLFPSNDFIIIQMSRQFMPFINTPFTRLFTSKSFFLC